MTGEPLKTGGIYNNSFMPQGEAIHLQWAVVPFIVHYIYVCVQCQRNMDEMEWLFSLFVGTRKDEETKEIDDTLKPSRSSR